MKDIITKLHILLVLSFYALSAINLFESVSDRDTYNLGMAIILYILAIKHEKRVLEKSEVDNGNESSRN